MEGIKFICTLWVLLILDVRKMNCQHTVTYTDILQKASKVLENDKQTSKYYQDTLQTELHSINHLAHELEEKLHMLLSTPSAVNHNQYPMLLDKKSMDLKEVKQYNISQACFNNLIDVINGLAENQTWAFEMLDSDFKPSAGIMRGTLTWLGDYDECVAVSVQDKLANGTHFNGKFCTAIVGQKKNVSETFLPNPIIQLVLGLCLPDSCSEQDTAAILDSAIYLLNKSEDTTTNFVQCQEAHRDLSGRAIASIVVLSIIGVFLVLGTGYDLLLKHFPYPLTTDEHTPLLQAKNHDEDIVKVVKREPGLLGEILLAFSMYTNGRKLLNTQQGSTSLRSIHGVRFLSMSWVILGHTLVFAINMAGNLIGLLSWMKRWTFQPILNGTFSVDTFFIISGLLLTYLTLIELEKNKGKLNWFMFYFHRYWRLTPPLALVMLAYIPLAEYWSDGPKWPKHGFEINYCESYWWRNLLYIQNLFDAKEMCMAWSWYLANDMQFFILSPLIIVPLFMFPILGFIVFSALLLGSVITTGVLSRVNDFSANILTGNPNSSFDIIYTKPWCRIGAYLIGMITGYILHKTKLSFQIKWYMNLLCWALATAIALAVIYGLTGVNQGNETWSYDVTALYNALSRIAWAVSVSWLVFACCTGNGGFINTILSWEAFIPLSRLTYMAYLIHPVIMYVVNFSRRTLFYITDLQYVVAFLGFMVGTYLIAFVLTLAFESPMIGLERVLLKREKRN